MAQGDKSKYTTKQRRQAKHIADGYIQDGDSREEAEAKAWATVNKIHGGGRMPGGSGRGKKPDYTRTEAEKRRTAALKGWETRRNRLKGG